MFRAFIKFKILKFVIKKFTCTLLLKMSIDADVVLALTILNYNHKLIKN